MMEFCYEKMKNAPLWSIIIGSFCLIFPETDLLGRDMTVPLHKLCHVSEMQHTDPKLSFKVFFSGLQDTIWVFKSQKPCFKKLN